MLTGRPDDFVIAFVSGSIGYVSLTGRPDDSSIFGSGSGSIGFDK
jgi:hypothetical protein